MHKETNQQSQQQSFQPNATAGYRRHIVRFFIRITVPLLMVIAFTNIQAAMAQLDNPNFTELVKINFQPKKAAVPDGYLVDFGKPFADRGNGFSYGWNQKNKWRQDRELNPDQRFDTFIRMQKKQTSRTWEVQLANGNYKLLISLGDPKSKNQINNLDVEGTLISDADGRDNFDMVETVVAVNDGRLTIKPAAGAKNVKINFIDIWQETTATDPGGNPTPTPTPPPGTDPPVVLPPLPTEQGLEVGIDLTVLDGIKTGIDNGEYDRPCTAAEHDRTRWHLLVDPVNKCHYDHQHGDDPNFVNDIFGEPGAWFGAPGQSVSYPWQTFKATAPDQPNDEFVAAGQMENDLKHEGYGWVVRRNQPCPKGNCTTDFRLQYHGIFGAHGAVTRYHSFSFEARVCADANDPASCGIIRRGGWADYGRLFTTDQVSCLHNVPANFISLPADTLFRPIERPESRDEIRCHPILNPAPPYPSAKPLAEWWAHGAVDTRWQLRSFDPLGNINPDNPNQWHTFCQPGDSNCHFNQSKMTAWIGYTLPVPEFHNGARLDTNRDGRTEYSAFSTRWGQRNEACTQAGLDCVPTIFENVPLNLYPDSNGVFKEARFSHTICESCQPVDYDLSPPGQAWNTWVFKYVNQ